MNIIPKPQKCKTQNGFFRILSKSRITLYPFNRETKQIAAFFTDLLVKSANIQLPIIPGKTIKTSDIHLTLEPTGLKEEGYKINVNARYIKVSAEKPAGLFYGIQTLLQLLPPEIYGLNKPSTIEIPVCKIEDKPHFRWRGMHLDVSRHFFSVTFIKKYIDYLAFHKMNKFHWHLTDDNGWRLEIKEYPLLQSISAWRVNREKVNWLDREPAKPGEISDYGGFYSEDDIRNIVKYAEARYVEIIPEIEMPGHSCEVLAAYPELGCFGKETSVATGAYWPNRDIFCAGKEETFQFLEKILDKVVELFPSKYIHIGGDEAYKENWEKCPNCQQRLKDENLKNTDQLQSWFIKRIEKYLTTKGKTIIGWDEILEGGLAPQATVMSWRGVKGGIAAAQSGHDVIMTPGTHCYFDHYQGDPRTEKKAIGGYTTLKKVYNFDPIPSELTQQQATHILGAQGNVWTEWISTEKHLEYMSIPRIAALAEIVWTYPSERNWIDFLARIQTQFKRYQQLGINYCPGTSVVEINPHFVNTNNHFLINLETEIYEKPIYYTFNDDEPDTNCKIFLEPLIVTNTCTLKAAICLENESCEKSSSLTITFHEALGKEITLSNDFSSKFASKKALTDGLQGSLNHNDGFWCGLLGKNQTAVVDLAKVQPIKHLEIHFLHNPASWIFRPNRITFLISNNSIDWETLFVSVSKIPDNYNEPCIEPHIWEGTAKARFVKIEIEALKCCPQWHIASTEPCWLFLDEFVILT